ncbi:fad NAD binding oxidoreductase [Acrodontium crateriforme]|uniref:Fad NAD binding oxidoreductase n=1 Tax=Acrodontium crateriforme TaxID=150365 RepID=A0AAQ3M4I7_9PEZI|nr:fad NAD binding oxidoreductase [Acrodontium crateriforme]
MASHSETKKIVIVGGGIIGATSAYYLTRHPSFNSSKHSITLLEASTIAGGASGKAGGLLARWAYPSSLVPLSYELHAQLAHEHGGEERWGYRTLHCGSVECKGNHLPSKTEGRNGDVDQLHHVSLEKKGGQERKAPMSTKDVPEDLDWLDEGCLRSYDPMGDPSTTAQVHPFQFTTSMATLAEEKGAQIKTGAKVSKINYTSDGSSVESVTYESGGKVETIPATDIVIAAGPWTQRIYQSAPITALRAHSVTIRPAKPVSAYALFTEIKLPSDFARLKSRGSQIVSPEIYTRPGNEIYACGDGDRLVPLPSLSSEVEVDQSRCQDIIDYVSSISGALRDGEVTARQACYLPNVNAPGSGGPLIGLTGVNGEVMAAGHTCWGIQNGPGTGKLVSEFVFDGEAKSANIAALDPRIVL